TPEPTGAELERLQNDLAGNSSRQTPEEWARILSEFTTRNAGRRTRLEVDDPSLGVQIQETGYSLMSAAWDHRERHIDLRLGVPWVMERDTLLPYDALAILAIVLLNASLGYAQELRAESAVAALRAMSAPEATVVREGERRRVAARELVAGDLLVVEAGDSI